MSRIKLAGIEIAVKNLNKTILISKDELSKKLMNKNADLKIEVLKNDMVVNGTTAENLIEGLMVCSNYYLPALELEEKVKKPRIKLEKLIRKGAEVKIEKFCEDSIKLIVIVNGKSKYHFYAKKITDLLKMVEESNKLISSELVL